MAAFSMVSSGSDSSDGDLPPQPHNAMRDMLGPGAVDQQIRQAIATCWMMLPDDKKDHQTVAAEIRRIVERALANMDDDAAAFGFGK